MKKRCHTSLKGIAGLHDLHISCLLCDAWQRTVWPSHRVWGELLQTACTAWPAPCRPRGEGYLLRLRDSAPPQVVEAALLLGHPADALGVEGNARQVAGGVGLAERVVDGLPHPLREARPREDVKRGECKMKPFAHGNAQPPYVHVYGCVLCVPIRMCREMPYRHVCPIHAHTQQHTPGKAHTPTSTPTCPNAAMHPHTDMSHALKSLSVFQ